jgi:predicted membrane protein
MDEILVKAALSMLRESQYYADDARAGAPLGNSVVGSLLAIQHRAPALGDRARRSPSPRYPR